MSNPYFNLIRTVWHYGKPWRLSIVGYYLAFVAAQACLSLSPYAFGRTIDILQNFVPGRLPQVIFWLCVGIAVIIIFWLFHGPARVIERKIALKIQQAFRLDLYEQFTHLPLKWHQDHHSGNIITRVNRASVALFRFAGDQFIYIESIIKFCVSSGFLLWISPLVGILSLTTCILAVAVVLLYDRKLIPLYDAENEIDNHVGAVLFDYISNMTTILTLRLGELTRSNLFQRLMSVWPIYNKELIINEVKWFTMMMVLNALQSVILISYIIHSLHSTGAVLIGLVVMIFRYQWDLSEVFYQLSMSYSDLVRMNTDVQGVNAIKQDIEKLAHRPQGEAEARQWHTLSIKDLNFHHAGSQDRGQLNQLSFDVKRGEKIALIGSSGGGKSTLLNLLSSLYTPKDVTLTIDGTTFNTLEPLQAITTLIPQDPELFENTIEFNITMDLPVSEDDIHRAIQLAQFSSVLETLPQGLKTDIREKGLNLSVGQKQRLALARGLFAARYSSLILMDEPTSSVDLGTETEILTGVIKAYPDAAMIVSLHRLHLLPIFDRIIMLDQGKLIASGPTAQLLHQPGPVGDLWQKTLLRE